MKLTLLLSLLFTSLQVSAFDLSTKGFLTFAYRKSDSDVAYKENITKDGEFTKGTKAGLQFHSFLSNRNEAFLQLLADGDNGRDFNTALDIAHITFNYANDHKLLYGKVRLPVWMISDYRQVGSLYPWVNPPEEVYEIVPLETVGVNDTFFGISFEGIIFQRDFQTLTYRFYHGGGERSGPDKETRVKSLHGLLLNYTVDDLTLKASYLNALSQGTQTLPGGAEVDASFGRAEYFSLGAKYDGERIYTMGEFSQVVAANKSYENVKSYYVMLGTYMYDQLFLLHGTISEVLDSSKSDQDIYQKTYTFGLNYNIDLSTVLKFEYKIVSLKKPAVRPMGQAKANNAGLFKGHPDKDVHFLGFSINTMF
ncbi:hypothetical protein A9Q84_19130 [Halobacteriovorax marinus]|uniref:Porin domain-containing protein n=1 Tax=Halobacteriovorax marinus TaxID=97084 RepID=A0A1Y5F2X5_9BACT|nr:hypothetical protein A9Q84_19130 [Halobacteriovorax marinus]